MSSVSIVMCTYNGAAYLARQLDSILDQTWPVAEILIQDDGSTDETCAIIRSYQEKYPFIRLVRNEKNLGFNLNFLTAIPKAKGDYIALSDQDDLWEPDKIATLVHCLETSGKAFVFSRSRPFSDDTATDTYFDTRRPNCSMERLIICNMASGHTMLFTRGFARELTPARFAQTSRWYYDHFIAAMAAAAGELVFCDRVLVNYRRHTEQVTADHDTTFLRTAGPVRVMRRACRLYREKKEVMTAYFRNKYDFFSSLPFRNQPLADALKMADLFTRRDPVSYLKLTFLCVKLRKRIFYTADVRPVALFFRSFVFPLYCALYFKD